MGAEIMLGFFGLMVFNEKIANLSYLNFSSNEFYCVIISKIVLHHSSKIVNNYQRRE